MTLKGFDNRWKNFPDYIIGITEEIWENRKISSIRDYYDNQVIVRTPAGITVGNEMVVNGTLSTLAEFPNRELLGEDVIWCGSAEDQELLSSHRILSTANHYGDGIFGKATGKRLTFRTIADCAAKDGVIFDEWLVRDYGAIVAQFGFDLKEFALKSIINEGGFENCLKPLTKESDIQGKYTGKGNDNHWGSKYASVISEIMNADISVIQREYNRAIHSEIPRGRSIHGWGAVEQFWMSLRSSFPSATLSIDHVIGREDSHLPPRAAVRWSLSGEHSGYGAWGKPSGAEVYILGISHAEFGDEKSVLGKIKREFTLYDELSISKQIILHEG